MATIGYADLPVPAGGDSPTIPAAVAELATALDPHLIHHVYDQAQRDADFVLAPVQTLVIAESGMAWIKLASSSNSWATVYEPVPAWGTITLASGYEQGAATLGVRKMASGIVYLKGRIQATSGNMDGGAAALNVGSVPDDCIPEFIGTITASCSLGGDTTDAAGRLEVLASNSSSSSGDPGDLLWWYQGTGGTPWIDISGYYWLA